MTIRLHRGDLPDLGRFGREVAVDTETMGLDVRRSGEAVRRIVASPQRENRNQDSLT